MSVPVASTVRHATLEDLDTTVAAYGAAIDDEAVFGWMLPDAHRRARLREHPGLVSYLRAMLETGVLVVAVTDRVVGVSVWLSVGDGADHGHDADEQDHAVLGEVSASISTGCWRSVS